MVILSTLVVFSTVWAALRLLGRPRRTRTTSASASASTSTSTSTDPTKGITAVSMLLVRACQARRTAPPPAIAAHGSSEEASISDQDGLSWTALDDLQLTRLLTEAARRTTNELDSSMTRNHTITTSGMALEYPMSLEIVGPELRSIERVTGRLTRGKLTLAGALSGLWIGVFVGIAFSLFSNQNELSFLVTTPPLGGGVRDHLEPARLQHRHQGRRPRFRLGQTGRCHQIRGTRRAQPG